MSAYLGLFWYMLPKKCFLVEQPNVVINVVIFHVSSARRICVVYLRRPDTCKFSPFFTRETTFVTSY